MFYKQDIITRSKHVARALTEVKKKKKNSFVTYSNLPVVKCFLLIHHKMSETQHYQLAYFSYLLSEVQFYVKDYFSFPIVIAVAVNR